MKKCNKCKETKPIEKFSKNRRAKDGLQNKCKACAKAYFQSEKGRLNNREAQNRYSQTEKGKEKIALYRQSDERKQTLKRYDQSSRGVQSAKRRQHRYRQTDNGKLVRRKAEEIRRTRKMQSDGSYSINEWYRLCQFYSFRCLKCDKQFPFEELTLDHVKPVSKGGTSFIFNIQPLCLSCNSSKGNKEIDYRRTLPDWIKRENPIWMQGKLF